MTEDGDKSNLVEEDPGAAVDDTPAGDAASSSPPPQQLTAVDEGTGDVVEDSPTQTNAEQPSTTPPAEASLDQEGQEALQLPTNPEAQASSDQEKQATTNPETQASSDQEKQATANPETQASSDQEKQGGAQSPSAPQSPTSRDQDKSGPIVDVQPVVVSDHRSYAGSFTKGRFYKTYKTNLESLSATELKAVNEDLQRNRDEKAIEMEEKKKIHAAQRRQRQAEEQAKIKRIEAQKTQLEEKRRMENVEKLSKWLAAKAVVLSSTVKEHKRILSETAARRKAKAELKEANEAREAAVREERIRRHKELQRRREERQQKEAAASRKEMVQVPNSTWHSATAPVSGPVTVTHHHLHHHIHYHTGSATGSRVERSVELSHQERFQDSEAGVPWIPPGNPAKPPIVDQIDCSNIQEESELAVMGDLSGSRPSNLMGSHPIRHSMQTAFPIQSVTWPKSQQPDHGGFEGQPYHNNAWVDLPFEGEIPRIVEAGWQQLPQDLRDYETELQKDQLHSASGSASRPGSRGQGLGPGRALRGMGLPRQGCQDLIPLGRVHSHATRIDLLALQPADKRITRSESAGSLRAAEEAPVRRKKEPYGAPVYGPLFQAGLKQAQQTYSGVRAPSYRHARPA